MRTPSLIAGTLLACGLVFAGQNESVVYTDGNLAGVATQTKAVLDMSQDAAMKLRMGRTDVSIPYASVTKAQAAEDSTTVPPPGKKGAKPAHLVTVEFNSVQGESRTLTLQMSKAAASHVLATIQKHSPEETKVAAVQTAAPPAEQPAAKPSVKPSADDKQAAKKAAQQAKADKKTKEKADKLAKKDKKKKDQDAKDNKEDQTAQANNEFGQKPPAKENSWWGDSAWKTTSNLPKWQQPGSSAAAQ